MNGREAICMNSHSDGEATIIIVLEAIVLTKKEQAREEARKIMDYGRKIGLPAQKKSGKKSK